jgi:hypothetical protein
MPGDGSEVHTGNNVARDDLNVNVVEVPGEKVSWKGQVVGV